MGRNKKAEIRKGYLIKLLEEERRQIEEKAFIAGLTTSEYIRRCALKKQVRSRLELKALGELSKLGGLQKHLLIEIKMHPHESELRGELNKTLSELSSAIRTVSKAICSKQ